MSGNFRQFVEALKKFKITLLQRLFYNYAPLSVPDISLAVISGLIFLLPITLGNFVYNYGIRRPVTGLAKYLQPIPADLPGG